ncbi:MAG: hypothetical protein R3E88_19825 [Myxococcota bacterium]
MTPRRARSLALVAAVALVAVVGLAAGVGRAGAPAAPATSTPAADETQAESLRARAERALATNEREASIRADWQRTYRDLLAELRDALQRHRQAFEERTRTRHNLRFQGAQRADIEERLRDSEHAIGSLQEEIAEFYERAREAEISGNWLDEVERDFEGLRGSLPSR